MGGDVRHRLHSRAGDGRGPGAVDLRLPFVAAGSLALLNLLYGYFVLPESLPADAGAHSHGVDESGQLAARLRAAEGRGAPRGRGRLQRARAVRAVHVLGAVYDLQVRLGPLENGWSLAAVGIVSAVVQGLLLDAS